MLLLNFRHQKNDQCCHYYIEHSQVVRKNKNQKSLVLFNWALKTIWLLSGLIKQQDQTAAKKIILTAAEREKQLKEEAYGFSLCVDVRRRAPHLFLINWDMKELCIVGFF